MFAKFASAAPTVNLTVLNVPNEFGEIVVVRGNNVEIDLTVTDPLNESSNQDIIRLIHISDGAIAGEQRRGNELTGSRSLATQKTVVNPVLGELVVQYVSATTNQVIASSDKNVLLVDNQSIVELNNRTTAVEQKVALTAEKAANAESIAITANTKADSALSVANSALSTAAAAQESALDALNRLEAAIARQDQIFQTLTNVQKIVDDLQNQIGDTISLLAYYPLDGDVLDASGNAKHGSVGGSEAYAAGHTGQAFSFDGATFISTALDINASVEPQLTMGAWVLPIGSFYGQVLTHDDQG